MRLRGLPGLLLLAIVLLFVLPSVAQFYTDWLWFRELGYEGVFLRTLNGQTGVFLASFAVVFVFLFVNLRLSQGASTSRPQFILGAGPNGRPLAIEGRQLAGMALPASLIVAGLFGFMNAANWLQWFTFWRGVDFGQRDPLLNREVAFYVFRLPVYESVREQLLLLSFMALIGCAIYYVFSGNFVIESRPGVSSWPRIRLIPVARRHLSVLTALVFVTLAWGAALEVPNTLLTPTESSVAFGASYADVYARIPFLWVNCGILVLGALLTLWHGFGRRSWPLPLAVAAYLVVAISGGLYASFVQRLVVTPNEQDKELPFIRHNIDATRRAYAVDRIEERELSGDAELSPADIVDNAGTIENVRLWDHQPLLQTFAQIQEIRTYYDFVSVDNDRYAIGGKQRQVMLSARELNTESMPNRSWVNERLTFTHGYGLTLGPVNQVTTEGLPVLFVRDLPPVSTVDLRVDNPSIYFGEISSSYALVNTRSREFHYPKGDDNEWTTYDGTGGVPLTSFWRRALFAMRFGSTDILVTNQITRESRVLFHRQIGERVRTLAPFLHYDADPYMVVSNGRLFWIQDAYTTTTNYPYSTPYVGPRQAFQFNYIRNSIKIVIDAYNGGVSFYVAEPDDPVIRTLSAIFGGMFKPLGEMPADLRQHVRYPEDIFRYQSQIYTSYHMTNPSVFYNKEDQWQVPTLENGQNTVAMQPYYTIMKLPREKQTEFIQMLPFTPRAKDNLAAWLVARSDGEHYGKLLAFQFPKQKIVFGPRQIVGRINQDQTISPQVTLWNQQGSEVIWGNLLVIPVNESLIYVRPLYLRSPEGRIPELKRVIVAYQSRIVMEETLTQGLVKIFGREIAAGLAPDRLQSSATSVVQTAEDVPPVPVVGGEAIDVESDPVLATLAAEAKRHTDAAQRALKDGDLAKFGEEWKQLQAIIERMQAKKK